MEGERARRDCVVEWSLGHWCGPGVPSTHAQAQTQMHVSWLCPLRIPGAPSTPTKHIWSCGHPVLYRRLPPTILCAAHAVQGARGNGDDFLPLQPLHLPRPSHMVVRAVAQPVIVTFAPARSWRCVTYPPALPHQHSSRACTQPTDKSHVSFQGQVMTESPRWG